MAGAAGGGYRCGYRIGQGETGSRCYYLTCRETNQAEVGVRFVADVVATWNCCCL